MKLARQLKELLLMVDPVVEKISDSYPAAGVDAYEAERKMYSYIKAAAESGAPGTDSIAAELKKRYVRRRKPSPEKNGNQEKENQESNDQ